MIIFFIGKIHLFSSLFVNYRKSSLSNNSDLHELDKGSTVTFHTDLGRPIGQYNRVFESLDSLDSNHISSQNFTVNLALALRVWREFAAIRKSHHRIKLVAMVTHETKIKRMIISLWKNEVQKRLDLRRKEFSISERRRLVVIKHGIAAWRQVNNKIRYLQVIFISIWLIIFYF